jgi:hypothetical protein
MKENCDAETIVTLRTITWAYTFINRRRNAHPVVYIINT